jgi:hypothetical protein
MENQAFTARVGRGVVLGLIVGLLHGAPHPAHAQDQNPDRARDARWRSDHVDLDLLPVAYVVRSRHLTVGGPVNMPPVGFPANTYSLYPNLTYGLTARTEATFGITGAQRLGPGGEATFYTLGLEHVLLPESGHLPTISLGAYGFQGPHDHRNGGAVFLVASQQLTPRAYPNELFAHLGVEFQGFSDGRSSSAAQPFVGANYVWSPRLRFSAEFRPRQPWERANLYSARAVVLLNRRIGISGGLRNNGYQTHPFIGIRVD